VIIFYRGRRNVSHPTHAGAAENSVTRRDVAMEVVDGQRAQLRLGGFPSSLSEKPVSEVEEV